VPAGLDAGQRLAGGTLEQRDRELLVGIDQVDEVVRHRPPLGR
jgi:hypothetical protein